MDMTNQEYGRYVSQKAKPSPLWKNLLWAFVTGGLICTGGQALLNLFRGCGLNENAAGTAVSVTIIFLAALLPVSVCSTSWPSTQGRARWYPSPDLPTRWSPRRWNSSARGWSWAWAPRCL